MSTLQENSFFSFIVINTLVVDTRPYNRMTGLLTLSLIAKSCYLTLLYNEEKVINEVSSNRWIVNELNSGKQRKKYQDYGLLNECEDYLALAK